MRVLPGRLVSLGHGRFVRSDEVVAIEPVTERRGPGRRTLVWIRGLPEPLIASRSDEAIARELVAPREQGVSIRELRTVVDRMSAAFEGVPPSLRRVVEEETGSDPGELAEEARRLLSAIDGRSN